MYTTYFLGGPADGQKLCQLKAAPALSFPTMSALDPFTVHYDMLAATSNQLLFYAPRCEPRAYSLDLTNEALRRAGWLPLFDVLRSTRGCRFVWLGRQPERALFCLPRGGMPLRLEILASQPLPQLGELMMDRSLTWLLMGDEGNWIVLAQPTPRPGQPADGRRAAQDLPAPFRAK